MRRAVAWIALVAALAASGVGAALLRGSLARAQSPVPPVQLRRVQHADYVPPPDGRRPIFILAIGSDARPGVCMPVERCLADSIHLIGINPQKRAATILGFPRDSYVQIPGHSTEKINNALFHGGPELVVRTVEELTGITIDYYMLASFDGVVGMVNDLGGLEVDVPYPMNDPASGANFDQGPQVLTGRDALAFSRNRKDTPDGDFSRSENQGLVMLAALRKLHDDFAEDPAALFRWMAIGSAHLRTDLSFSEVFDLLLAGLSIEPQNVTNVVTPGDPGYAGAASVVFLRDEADRMFDDMKKDGLLAR